MYILMIKILKIFWLLFDKIITFLYKNEVYTLYMFKD